MSRLRQETVELNDFERRLVNHLQSGFPLDSAPYEELAEELDSEPQTILDSIADLLERGVLTRFGPLLNIEKLGGVFSLCALRVPEQRFDEVCQQVNALPQVAHNYRREHSWNMWFVLACDNEAELEELFAQIMQNTDCPGLNLPKEKEFYVGLRLEA